jgi:hypothetical protein
MEDFTMLYLRRRVALLAGLLLALCAALPAHALAAPSDESCAAYASLTYTMPIPSEMRTVGVHHIDWHNTFVDENGDPQVFDAESQIEVAAAAPSYDGQVLLRLFSNWAAQPGADANFDVEVINPQQRASFYVVSTYLRGTPNALTDAMSIRWEGVQGFWSDWISLPRSPERSFCEENFRSLFTKAHGWAIG